MRRTMSFAAMLLVCSTAYAVQRIPAVTGTVKTIDRGGKVVVVESSDGVKHTFHFGSDLAVHAGDGSKAAGTDTFHGVEKGSRVAVHFTSAGGVETAHEIDRVDDGGLKVIKGTVKGIDRGARKISIQTASGTVETVHLSIAATDDAVAATEKGVTKAAKVSVYYTEEAGKKTGHFVEKIF